MTADILTTLCSRWRAANVALRPAASEADIQNWEREKEVRLSADLRSLLLMANGMEEGEMDPRTMVRFWPLEEIREASKELGSESSAADHFTHFFVFADYSLWAHAYAIQLTNDRRDPNPVVIVGGDVPIHVATSFSHFIEKYLSDPQQVL